MDFHIWSITILFWLLVQIVFLCHGKQLNYLRGCFTSEFGKTNESWITMEHEHPSRSVEFRLLRESEGCGEKAKRISINTEDWLHSETHLYFNGTKAQHEIRVKLSLEGTIEITDYHNIHNRYLPKSSYCIRKQNDTWSQIEMCCTHKTPCYRKCCQLGESFDFDLGGCAEINKTDSQDWQPPVHIQSENRLYRSRNQKQMQPEIGLPNCSFPTYISTALMKLNYSRIPYIILENGDVRYLDTSNQKKEWKETSKGEDYCIDSLLLPGELTDTHCGFSEQDILLVCLEDQLTSPDVQPKNLKMLRIIYVVCLAIAMLFLAATAVVNFLLKEKQNIHAWTIQCYVLSQFCFYFFLVIIYVGELVSNPLPNNWCVVVGVLTHFFGIFSFSWLSIINFDLWLTFRVLKPLNQKDIHCKRFLWYAIFATALPVILISVSVGLHFYYEKDETCRDKPIDVTIYPEYGKEICFLSNSAQLFYFYIPVGVLLLINLTFYAFTTYKIFNLYKVSQRVASMKHRQSCQLFLKLFLVMGTAWSFQVIHAFVEGKESKWYWVLLDMVNMFQAIAIFVIFVCKRETLRSLEIKYPVFKGICCRFHGIYRTPTITDSRTDGSTRLSRADGHKSGESQEPPAESLDLIQLGN